MSDDTERGRMVIAGVIFILMTLVFCGILVWLILKETGAR